MALCSLIHKNCQLLAENYAKNAIRRTAGENPYRSVAKTPAFAGYHETLHSPNWGSVHFTVYYSTEAKWESQEKFHKNIKNSTQSFDKGEKIGVSCAWVDPKVCHCEEPLYGGDVAISRDNTLLRSNGGCVGPRPTRRLPRRFAPGNDLVVDGLAYNPYRSMNCTKLILKNFYRRKSMVKLHKLGKKKKKELKNKLITKYLYTI